MEVDPEQATNVSAPVAADAPETSFSSSSRQYDLKIKTLTGQLISIGVSDDDLVKTLKERVEEKVGIPPSQQRLIFGGKVLADEKTLLSWGLGPEHTLHLVLALRGGA